MTFVRTNFDRIVDIDKTQLEYGEEVKLVADSIDKLCDKFIFINKVNPMQYIYDCVDVAPEDYYLFDIYGAIWTTKGLIYVAKINKSGEWELL